MTSTEKVDWRAREIAIRDYMLDDNPDADIEVGLWIDANYDHDVYLDGWMIASTIEDARHIMRAYHVNEVSFGTNVKGVVDYAREILRDVRDYENIEYVEVHGTDASIDLCGIVDAIAVARGILV